MFNRELFLETQTSRCLLCDNAPCSHACTSHLPVSDIIRSFRFENHMGAAEKSERSPVWIAAIRCA